MAKPGSQETPETPEPPETPETPETTQTPETLTASQQHTYRRAINSRVRQLLWEVIRDKREREDDGGAGYNKRARTDDGMEDAANVPSQSPPKPPRRSPSGQSSSSNANISRNFRKKKKINNFCKPGTGDEWLLSATEAETLLLNMLKGLDLEETRILIPGVGFANTPLILANAGYKKIVAVDIDPSAIQYQRTEMANNIKARESTRVCEQIPLDEKFDVIIDKSFLDVFLRQRQKDVEFWSNRLWGVLANGGTMVIISMFHRKWKCVLKNISSDCHAYYKSIHPEPYNPPGKRVRKRITAVCLITASFDQENAKRLCMVYKGAEPLKSVGTNFGSRWPELSADNL